MPRIVPLQLLKCLKVLLDDNGGILSESEVKRIAGLMTKYSKKLVSKCIYVQILKCTKTELLGEFMSAGGWSLTHLWLNDAIRAMNWPLVQEILELLLLCPVDVDRLKSNSAPKLVKGLCKDGGNEGVRILAVKLVEQWLKVVTSDATAMAPRETSVNSSPLTLVNQSSPSATVTTFPTNVPPELKKQQKLQETPDSMVDEDPLADVGEEPPVSYSLTPAQKKATESGLIYKIVVKDGQQVFAKIESKNKTNTSENRDQSDDFSNRSEEEKHKNKVNEKIIDSQRLNMKTQEGIATEKDDKCKPFTHKEDSCSGDENSNSTDSKSNDSVQALGLDKQNSPHKKEQTAEEKSPENKNYHKSALMSKKEEKLLGSGKDKKSNESDRKSSSSSHRSSSFSSANHKSSSKSNNSSNRSLSSSSSYRNSADGKPYSSSSNREKDKDRNCNNGNSAIRDKDSKEKSGKDSSKYKSSSSSGKSISSNSSKDRHRDKEKTNLSSSKPIPSPVEKIDKEKDREISNFLNEKDKVTLAKTTSSLEKIGKIPKKLREENASSSGNITKPTSITIPSKKASMSIEIRRDNEKAKTVKTYKSQFRSHGLTEEAPPPPSRKGLKKPSSLSLPGTAIPATIPSLKRSSPPPINTSGTVVSRDSPIEKKSKIDINNLSVPNEKPGAIKLIPPKPKIQTLVETNLFSDALSAATGSKKDTRKRKRPNLTLANKDTVTTSPVSPDVPKVAPLKFYQDTLDENKDDDKRSETPSDSSCTKNNIDKDVDSVEDDDDIPLKKVKDDIDEKVRREMQKTGSLDSNACNDADADTSTASVKTISDCNDFSAVEPDSPKKPGPGCGPNGPPGVLLLHRRKGPKKKLMWRPQDQLEQIRYFDLDETERVNVTKNFIDMKNLERFSERDAINMSRRGFNHEDNMEAQISWKPLVLIDDVPPQPEGNNSKERKVQADREQTTLRALYFSHAMIPDSPAEPDIEPHQPSEFTIIPLDDITANPDAVNDFTSMPWPDPKGSPQHESVMDSNSILLTDLYGPSVGNSPGGGSNPFSPFMPYGTQPNPVWPMNSAPQGPLPNNLNGINPMNLVPPSMICGTGTFNGPMGPHRMALLGGPSSPSNIDNFGGGASIMTGPGGPMGNGMPPNIIAGIGGQGGHNRFGGPVRTQQFGPPSNFPPGGGNFGPPINITMPMNGPGPGMLNGPMNIVGHITMNGLPANESIRCGNGNSHRGGGGGGWRSGVSNFNDGNWRSANSVGAGGHSDRCGQGNNRGKDNWVSNTSNICKQYMRSGNCRLGNKCKFIHPGKGGGSKNRY